MCLIHSAIVSLIKIHSQTVGSLMLELYLKLVRIITSLILITLILYLSVGWHDLCTYLSCSGLTHRILSQQTCYSRIAIGRYKMKQLLMECVYGEKCVILPGSSFKSAYLVLVFLIFFFCIKDLTITASDLLFIGWL